MTLKPVPAYVVNDYDSGYLSAELNAISADIGFMCSLLEKDELTAARVLAEHLKQRVHSYTKRLEPKAICDILTETKSADEVSTNTETTAPQS